MQHRPSLLLAYADPLVRQELAAGLRSDGMDVIECALVEQALNFLERGANAAILVAEPATGRLTDMELVEHARDAAPHITVILTPDPAVGRLSAPPGAFTLPKPLEASKLSRYIRLVAARPALRSRLQHWFRSTHADNADQSAGAASH